MKNIIYTLGFRNHNLCVFKNFKMKEKQRIRFRMQAFNWVNHPNWNGPGLDTRSSGTFGKAQSKSSERSLQFSLHTVFRGVFPVQ